MRTNEALTERLNAAVAEYAPYDDSLGRLLQQAADALASAPPAAEPSALAGAWYEGQAAGRRDFKRGTETENPYLIAPQPAEPAQPATQAGAGEPLQFVCQEGCGVCGVRLTDFEVFRSETMEGELIESRTVPQIVSTCCGSPVDVWDERKQDVVGPVEAAQPTAQPSQDANPPR